MAAITSNAVTGNWSSTSTWSGGVVPGDGDTVTLANGAAITVDVDTTVGSDPATAGTAAIAWPAAPTAATSLTIAAGKTLRAKGGIAIRGHSTTPFEAGTLTLAAGAALVFDPKAGQQHTLDFSYRAELICNGTSGSGNRCTVRTDLTRTGLATLATGSGAGLLGQNLTTNGGLTTASYTDFSNFGTTSSGAIGLVTYFNNNYGTDLTASITNCTFTAASYWWLAESTGGGIWDGTYTLADCTWTSTPAFTFAGYSMGIGFSTGTIGNSHLHSVVRCSFDAGVLFDSTKYVTFTSCVFAGGKGDNGTSSWPDDSYFDSNLMVWPTSAAGGMSGSIKNVYNVLPAARSCWQTTVTGLTATGCVFEQVAGSNAATPAAFSLGSSTHALTVTRSFILSNAGGGSPLRMFQQNVNGSITMDHCLLWGNGGVLGCGIDLADAATPTAGKVPSCRANILFYPTASSNTYLITENAGGGAFVTDVVTVADYNGMFHANNGTCKGSSGGTSASIPGYLSLQTSDVGTPPTTHLGLHDLQADPVFADQTYRGIVGWANRTQGQAATWAATIAYLQANPSLVPTMLQWVREGYKPTATGYKSGTYPGDALTTDANGNPLNGTIGPMALVDYSLSVTKGTFTETGNAVGLYAGRKVAISAGSYAETSNATGFLVSRVFVVSAGTFTETGNAIGLNRGRTMAFATGSFVETGNAINFASGRALSISTRAFVETGNAIGLQAGRIFTVATASFVETGSAISFLRARSIIVTTASYALTGNAVGLHATRVLAVGAGSYALAGQPIRLRWSGSDLSLAVGTGLYTFVGRSIGLQWSGHPAPSFIDPDEITMIAI